MGTRAALTAPPSELAARARGDNLIITLDLLIRPKGGGAVQRDRFFSGAV